MISFASSQTTYLIIYTRWTSLNCSIASIPSYRTSPKKMLNEMVLTSSKYTKRAMSPSLYKQTSRRSVFAFYFKYNLILTNINLNNAYVLVYKGNPLYSKPSSSSSKKRVTEGSGWAKKKNMKMARKSSQKGKRHPDLLF